MHKPLTRHLLDNPFLCFNEAGVAGEGGSGGGGGGGAAGEGGAGTSGAGGEGSGGAPDKTFTQADLDRIVQDRVARERSKFADYDAYKDKATKFDDLEAANKSELDKAKDEAVSANAARDAALEAAKQMKLESVVMTEAAKQKAVDPAAVFALLPKDKVTVGDDGQVTGVEEAIKALLDEKKYLVGTATTATGSGEGGARGGNLPAQLSREDLKSMTPDEIVKAKSEGRLKNVLEGVTT